MLPGVTLPGALRIGLLLASLPAAAATGAVRAEPPPAEPAPAPLATPGDTAPRGALRSAKLDFGLYALGAKAFDMKLNLQRDGDAITVDTEMQTFGLVNFLMSFEMTGHVAAQMQAGRIVPVRYRTDSDGSWSKRSTRIVWDADGMPTAEVQPPVDQDDRDPVPDALKRNTMDPTTAIVARALHSGDAPPCNGIDAIFDGRRRYNLHFSPVGPAMLKPNDRSTYAGPAYECAVRLEPIAGYRHGDDADTRAVQEHVTRLWLTRPPGIDVWIPVQIDSGISLGSVTGWIAGATLNGKTWLAPLPPIRYAVERPNTP